MDQYNSNSPLILEHKEKPCCVECFEAADKCGRCKHPVVIQKVTALNQSWHSVISFRVPFFLKCNNRTAFSALVVKRLMILL